MIKLLPLLVCFSLAIETVGPGDTHTNRDGVTAGNGANSTGNVTVDPAGGNTSSITEVVVEAGANASIEDIDANDIVVFESGSDGIVSGNGGTIEVYSDCIVLVINDGPDDMLISFADGRTITIKSGSIVQIDTIE